MAGPSESPVYEALLDTEVGSLTLTNIKTYYNAYVQEELNPVSYWDFVRVLESYYRNSAIDGEA